MLKNRLFFIILFLLRDIVSNGKCGDDFLKNI